MNKFLKVDNIMFYVKDLVKAENYYSKVLGLNKVWEDKDRKMMGFQLAQSDAEIVIHNDDSLPKFDYSFLVENVVHFCEAYQAGGYKIKEGPMKVRSGMYAVLEDEDGNGLPIIDLTAFDNKPRFDL